MEKDNENKTSTETVKASSGILDDEYYTRLDDPESEGFGNKSKDIDKLVTNNSHKVIDYYKYEV